MILTPTEVDTAYQAWVLLYGLPPVYQPRQVVALLQLAAQTQAVLQDEPASMLYALGRYPRAFGAGWVETSRLLVTFQAHRGQRLVSLDVAMLRPVLFDIAAKQLTPDQVRSWLWERTTSRG